MFIKLYITLVLKRINCKKWSFSIQFFYRIICEVNMDLSQSFRKKPEKCGKIFSPHILLFDLKLDHNSARHAKIREKSLLIDSRIEFPDPILMTLDRGKIIFSPLWFLILKLDHNSGLHAKIRVQNWVYCPKVSEFRHPTWTYHKVFEKMSEKCGENKGGNYCSYILLFD